MTEKHLLLTDHELVSNIKNCELSPVLFTHEAHLRLAYIHLTNYDKATAIESLCSQLAQFDRQCGSGTKFDKKLTEISVEIVDEFIKKNKPKDFRSLICSCPVLKHDFKSLVRQKMQVLPIKIRSKKSVKRSVQFS
ncbi:DNA-binding protein [Flavobacteriaceae bacterium F08102]|nr:DNA-binding protein [Flavobacteriaceae bacterium F08102]